jgi:hypothetical protein
MPRQKVIYQCIKCNWSTNKKSNFETHKNRKTDCSIIKSKDNLSNVNQSPKCTNNIDCNNTIKNDHITYSKDHLSNVNPIEKNATLINRSNMMKHYEHNNLKDNLSNVNLDSNSPDNELKCQKCTKIFSSKYCLKTHQSKCTGISCLKCPTCGKDFSTRQAKSKHIKRNTCETISIANTIGDNNIIGNNIGNITNNNTHNIIHIHLPKQDVIKNNHGNEDFSYIYDKYKNDPEFKNLLDIVKKRDEGDVSKMIQDMYFHPEHPENHTIQIKNLRSNCVKIYVDGDYYIKDTQEALPKVVDAIDHVIGESIDAGQPKYDVEHVKQKKYYKDVILPEYKRVLREHDADYQAVPEGKLTARMIENKQKPTKDYNRNTTLNFTSADNRFTKHAQRKEDVSTDYPDKEILETCKKINKSIKNTIYSESHKKAKHDKKLILNK